jgi:hypothetical protein
MHKVPQGEAINQKVKDKGFDPRSPLDRGTRGKRVQPGRVKWKKIWNVV